MLQRKIEDVPTRTELVQYERRFVELYDQVSSRLEETRNYYDSYNTLDDTKRFLAKEVSLLKSIETGFPAACASKSGRAAFVKQLDDIIDGMHTH